MNTKRVSIAVAGTVGALVLTGLTIVAQPQSDEPPEMGFFITSVGLGDGGNLGGLAGADAHCEALAEDPTFSRPWQPLASVRPPRECGSRAARAGGAGCTAPSLAGADDGPPTAGLPRFATRSFGSVPRS